MYLSVCVCVFTCVCVCIYMCVCVCRLMLMEELDRPQLWNLFNQVTINSQDLRHHRFCLRLMLKNPDNHALSVLCGHNALVSGSFKHALGVYTPHAEQQAHTHTQTDSQYTRLCSSTLCVSVCRSICAGVPCAPRRPSLQLVCGPHLLSHGCTEVHS